ncbi:small nuclear ribonucleoprotein Sm D3 [Coemansia nantahalensis]|nr:small nuclear ribonucleoprotein Sm D3 [Coemansia nantahalensis]
MSIGVPVKLLHESQGHVITLELKTGQHYRGKLVETEDNMNVQLRDITVTGRDGQTSHLQHVYVRGSNVRFFIVPDMLKNAPMFKHMDPKLAKARGIGMGRGKTAVGRGRGRGRGGGGGGGSRGRSRGPY